MTVENQSSILGNDLITGRKANRHNCLGTEKRTPSTNSVQANKQMMVLWEGVTQNPTKSHTKSYTKSHTESHTNSNKKADTIKHINTQIHKIK